MSSTTNTNTSSSSSSNPSSTTPPRRQSCDRCHSQKLRCTRASNGGSSNSPTGVCNRCLRLGAQCIYSPCLPKGRPPAVFRPPPTPAPTPALAPAPILENNHGNHKNNNAAHQQQPLPDELLNLDVDASLVWPTWVPPLETVDWSALNMTAMDLDGSGTAAPSPPLLPAAAFLDPVETTTTASSSSSEAASYISGPSAVYQLSELITRLYALHRQSSALTEAATAGRALGLPLIINDATFPPVAAWLQHLSANSHTSCAPSLSTPPGSLLSTPTGETLHGTFSAAHSLLAVLDRLQAEPAPSAATPSSTTDGVDTTDFWDLNINTPLSSSASSYFDLSMATPPSAAPARPSLLHSSSSTVVRHLVGACHSLLMNVFIGPLDALQHDADLNLAKSGQAGQGSQAGQATANPASPGPISDSSGLAHLRLVMVTHLCSYLIRRLQHAVSLYSSPPLSGSESLSDLDDQIWKRLAQLRATLHI